MSPTSSLPGGAAADTASLPQDPAVAAVRLERDRATKRRARDEDRLVVLVSGLVALVLLSRKPDQVVELALTAVKGKR